MITLLNPEAHEVTSAVIVPEEGGFKIVVNKASIQNFVWRKSVNDCRRYFRDHFALTRCAWKSTGTRS